MGNSVGDPQKDTSGAALNSVRKPTAITDFQPCLRPERRASSVEGPAHRTACSACAPDRVIRVQTDVVGKLLCQPLTPLSSLSYI